MKLHRWQDIRNSRLSPEEREEADKWVEAKLLEMNLRGLREALGLTQVEAAQAAEMSQGDVSKAERRGDHLLSTLQRLVKAMGGELEVYANVKGKRVRLVGV